MVNSRGEVCADSDGRSGHGVPGPYKERRSL
jgi:hypothetical protein